MYSFLYECLQWSPKEVRGTRDRQETNLLMNALDLQAMMFSASVHHQWRSFHGLINRVILISDVKRYFKRHND